MPGLKQLFIEIQKRIFDDLVNGHHFVVGMREGGGGRQRERGERDRERGGMHGGKEGTREGGGERD